MTTTLEHTASAAVTTGKVVAALDGSPASAAAVRWAAELARAIGTQLLVAHRPHDMQEVEQLQRDGLPIEPMATDGLLRSLLVDASHDALTVVAPTRGADAPIAHVLDARADELLSRAQGPVALVPSSSWNRLTSGVIVGLDLDRPGMRALDFAHHLATRSGAPLRILVAHTTPHRSVDEVLLAARRLVEDNSPDHAGPREIEVMAWNAAEGLAAAGMDAGVVVVGSRATGYRSAHPDSQSRRLLRQATCPVVVVNDLG